MPFANEAEIRCLVEMCQCQSESRLARQVWGWTNSEAFLANRHSATNTATFRCDGCEKRYNAAQYINQWYMFFVGERPVSYHLAACSQECLQVAKQKMDAKDFGLWQEMCERSA